MHGARNETLPHMKECVCKDCSNAVHVLTSVSHFVSTLYAIFSIHKLQYRLRRQSMNAQAFPDSTAYRMMLMRSYHCYFLFESSRVQILAPGLAI